MGVDPLSLALIGSTIFSGIQMSKKRPSPKPMAAPAEQKTVEESRKKRRPRFRAAMDQLALGTPSLGVAGNILS